ncbi:MAG: permease [Pseudoxanthomonas spadix]|nr:MAG: permease [Pseudoxanthomonas spadix]
MNGVSEAGNSLEQHAALPVAPGRRVAVIDVLRGVALFGVLSVNLITEFRVSVFQQFLQPTMAGSRLDRLVDAVVSIGMELKAFALFSLLFGVGLAIQFERLASKPQRRSLLVRRLLVLLGFGILHLCLIWNGDILTEYALIGLLALPFLYLPSRALIVFCAAALLLYAAMPSWLPDSFFGPDEAGLRQYIRVATSVYATGPWSEVVRFNMAEIPRLVPLHVLVAPRTFALFLLGVLVWRTGLLRDPERHRRLFIGIAVVGLVLGLGMSLLTLPGPGSSLRILAPLVSALTTLAPVVLAIGYGATCVALYTFTRLNRLLGLLGPLGRMAFSNYLAQSLVFGWIFFGYGLGLFGRLGASQAMLLGIAVYVAQVLISHWWLKRFRFGPMEWLWRTLMYGVRQPWRVRDHRL